MIALSSLASIIPGRPNRHHEWRWSLLLQPRGMMSKMFKKALAKP